MLIMFARLLTLFMITASFTNTNVQGHHIYKLDATKSQLTRELMKVSI